MAAAAAKIAVLLAVAALFAAAGADDPQATKEAGCWECYSTCMHKCDGYPDAPARTANRTEPAAHIAVDDGAEAASVDPVHSSDGAVAHVSDDSYDDKGDDEDDDKKDKNGDKDDDKKDDADKDEDEDEDDDDYDNRSGSSGDGKDYFTCKKKCIVDCYKDFPPVCYKMCVAQTCLTLPPYKQGECFKACGHKCFHKHPSPKPKPPSPKPPTPKPPSPKPPSPKPPSLIGPISKSGREVKSDCNNLLEKCH
uniref:Uncharacterized protein n=1 Tax=Avena sativa TaxID=4498 RepID=A0ACD5VIZ2_AVESA